MIEGKTEYNRIEIPAQLDGLFDNACRKGRARLRNQRNRRLSLAAAACLCIFLLCNVDAVYVRASEVPVIGTLVRILHIGDGGAVTDGLRGGMSAQSSGLKVQFSDTPSDAMPHYEINYYTMPRRIQVNLYGVRDFNRESLKETAAGCAGVKASYFLTVLDDSQVAFVLELADGMGYEASEYRSPAGLQFQFGNDLPNHGTPQETAAEQWTVRTASMENGEPLAAIQEVFTSAAYHDASSPLSQYSFLTVRTKSGLFTLTAGTFDSEEAAQAAVTQLNAASPEGVQWHTEKGTEYTVPK